MRTLLIFARLVGRPLTLIRALWWGYFALAFPLHYINRSPLDSSVNWFPAPGDTPHVAALWHSTLLFALAMGSGAGSLIRREMTKMTFLMLPRARNSITALYVVLAAAVTIPAWVFMAAHPVWPTQITFAVAAFTAFALAAGAAKYPEPWLNVAAFVFMILLVVWPFLFGIIADVAPRAFCSVCIIVAACSLGAERRRDIWQSRVEDMVTGRAERQVPAPPLAPVSRPAVAAHMTAADSVKQPRSAPSALRSAAPRPDDLKGHDLWSYFRAVVFENEGEILRGKTRYPILVALMIIGCIGSRLIWHDDSLLPYVAVTFTLEEFYEPRLLRTLSRDMRALLVFLASTRKTLILLALSYAAMVLTRLLAHIVPLPASEDRLQLAGHLFLGSLVLVLMPFAHWFKLLVKRRWRTTTTASLAGFGICVAVILMVARILFSTRREAQFGVVVLAAGMVTYTVFYLLLRWRFSRSDLVYRP